MSKKQIQPIEFKNQLNQLVNEKIWSTVAGAGTGSVFTCELGEKILREIPLTNTYLTEEQRLYEGEIGGMIRCGWRIEKNGQIICGSGDSNENGGKMLMGLDTISGKAISSVEIKPYLDLAIFFEDNSILRLFCDIAETDELCYNFTFNKGDSFYFVEGGKCYYESCQIN